MGHYVCTVFIPIKFYDFSVNVLSAPPPSMAYLCCMCFSLVALLACRFLLEQDRNTKKSTHIEELE